MQTIFCEKDAKNQKLEIVPERFDMAINFYCCIKKDDKYYLVTYYNPAWNLYYPFYDDINKTPILKKSNSSTYSELISETNSVLKINLEQKLDLAHARFREIFGCKCSTTKSKIKEFYEIKYSKTAHLHSVYKLYSYIITNVEKINMVVQPKQLQCKLFDIDNLDNNKIIGNAVYFCEKAKNELKKYAITI